MFDYEQKANVAGGQTSPYLKTRTMDIEEIERFSRTHVKFKGKDGEEVEVKDGIAYATNPDTALSTLFGSRALAGTALEPHEMRHAMASVGSTRPQVNSSGSGSAASPRHYATADLTTQKAPMRQPVCGSPFMMVSASSIDFAKELEALEEEAITRLKERGIDVEGRLADMAARQARRLQEGAADGAAARRPTSSPVPSAISSAATLSASLTKTATFDTKCPSFLGGDED